MMADLMDEDMSHDNSQSILAFTPEVEERTAIEPDHIRQTSGFLDRRSMCESAPISWIVSSSGKSSTWMTNPSQSLRNSAGRRANAASARRSMSAALDRKSVV